jgi:hypothetical protein
MKYESKTEEELQSVGTLEGIFDFEITKAREYVSDKGNETFELALNVFDTDGTPRPRKDWVTPAFAKKFKHLHDACGLLEQYGAGTTTEDDLVGKTGELKMSKKKYINKDGLEVTGDQVEDYIKRASTESYKDAVKDDDVPF